MNAIGPDQDVWVLPITAKDRHSERCPWSNRRVIDMGYQKVTPMLNLTSTI